MKKRRERARRRTPWSQRCRMFAGWDARVGGVREIATGVAHSGQVPAFSRFSRSYPHEMHTSRGVDNILPWWGMRNPSIPVGF